MLSFPHKGGNEDFHSNAVKIAEKRTLADVNRRCSGVDGQFSAANRR